MFNTASLCSKKTGGVLQGVGISIAVYTVHNVTNILVGSIVAVACADMSHRHSTRREMDRGVLSTICEKPILVRIDVNITARKCYSGIFMLFISYILVPNAAYPYVVSAAL